MSSVVLKIKCGQSLRRLVVPARSKSLDLTFAQLEAKIREYFSIPASSKLQITYVDQDGDSVTLTEDQELLDACFVQLLNPLRLFVSVEQQGETKAPEPAVAAAAAAAAAASLKSALEGLNEELKPVIQSALKGLDETALKKVFEPALGESGLFSDFFQSISKHAAAAAAAAAAPGESSAANGTSGAGAAAVPEVPKGAAADGSKGVGLSSETPPAIPELNPGAYHYNVQCDACGACPIVGPRFKSHVKHDYDLCLNCFNQLPEGREAQYIRHDRPLPVKGWAWTPRAVRRSASARAPYTYSQQYRCPFNQDAFNRDGFWSSSGSSRWGGSSPNWASAVKPESKPDCRFVCDVTIPDGTAVAPGTRLVKIWRLRNSGRCSWPCDTRLIRAGGDQLGPVSGVALEMPSDAGLAPGAEVEVAVDLVAPESPGRYVSYWRLMTPGGVKFGHRVWAMIQVTQAAPMEDTQEASAPVLGDKPGDCGRAIGQASFPSSKVLENKADDDVVEVRVVSPEAPVVVVEAETEPLEEAVSVVSDEDGLDADVSVEGFSLVEAPKDEGGVVAEGNPFEGDSESSLMDGFLRMGFSDKSLIAEFLAKNANDFQKTLDDLVSASDWDPILVELEEMGFYDAQMNRRLMVKNNGSVKRVVKELVQMYKDPAAKN